MTRERDDSGKYAEEVSLDMVLDVFKEAETPVLTATEVSQLLACSRPTAYNKLEELVELSDVEKKTVGSRAVVYIRINSS